MSEQIRITVEEPVIIAQADPSVRHWGPYQFPYIASLPDGTLHCHYHVEMDSALAYGKDGGNAISKDGGKTWQYVDHEMTSGLLLPNGDRVRPANKAAARIREDELPKQFLCENVLNAYRVPLYNPDEIPMEYGGYYLSRQKAGQETWEEERIELHVPFATRILIGEIMPYQGFTGFRLGPDGTLWGVIYQFTYKDRRAGMAAILVTSDDCGYSFRYRSSIYYHPDKEDRFWALRTGYTEPDIAFLPDGSIMCLMRVDDSFNRGPSYCAYSKDQGYTWTTPERFDDRGVWPRFLSLDDGITLAGYGRYGLFLRATGDPAGRDWDPRIAIVEPDGERENTCAYCDLLRLDGHSFYLVYSDFDVPNADGLPCKTILGRRGTAERIAEHP